MKQIILISTAFALLVACSATNQHKVLSFFFDGVPEPRPAAAPTAEEMEPLEPAEVPAPADPFAPEREVVAADLVAGGFAAIDKLPLRPVPKKTSEQWLPADVALEKAASWEEALRILPLDVAGGVDWVEAVKQGLTVPKLVLDVDATVPYTLDNLVVGGAARPDSPFLDFTAELTSEDNPIFTAVFPHSSHTLFLACSSCHPGVLKWDVPMEDILAGAACGKCHGRVSFAPETGCPRCHESLVPPDDEVLRGELEKARTEPVPASPELLERGEALYRKDCALCHGEDGDGVGRLARWLTTKPRNFKTGTYKFRSGLGPLPTDLDLFRTITRGVPGTSMPAWSVLGFEDRWALVHYVKTFSEWFKEEKPGEPIAISEPPAATPELLKQGEELYTGSGCNACHGDGGRGDGPSAKTLKDSWGQPIRPYNFASGRPMKSGSKIEDIYRVVMTGIGGTPMPVFGESLSPQQGWALARYVEAFRGRERAPFNIKGDILFDHGGLEAPEETVAAAAEPGKPAAEDSGGFWGYDDDEADDEGAAASAGGFWGYDDEAAAPPEPEPAAASSESFWGYDDEKADDEGAAAAADSDDFWGAGGDDEGGGDSFWDDGGDAAAAGSDSFRGEEEAAGASIVQPEVPPATFPHWFHRIRFKCANCHPRVFEMKAGADPITMDAMRAGLYCAKCHNGKIAWEIGFTACPRCHQARTSPDG